MCKGINKSWHLQLATASHFNKHNREYNFNNPAWLVLSREEPPRLTEQTDAVLRLLARTGGIAMEVFGLNFWDFMEMDRPTFTKVKKAIYDVCEERNKEREERERIEAERLKEEARRRAEEERRQRQQH
jgi:hypothetical protein